MNDVPNKPPPAKDVRGSLRQLRVLVIEDSWNVACNFKAVLEGAGAHVLGPVPTAAQAIEIITKQPVSLALVDMNLRESFADSVIDELQARQIPHVIVTAYRTLPSDADRFAAGILHKPVDPDELIGFVSRFVAG